MSEIIENEVTVEDQPTLYNVLVSGDKVLAVVTETNVQGEILQAPEGFTPDQIDNYAVINGVVSIKVPQEISALAGLAVIDQFGLSDAYTVWATSPERTFMEKAFIEKAVNWRRSNTALIQAATTLGLSSEQLDQMFILGKQIDAMI